MPRKGITEGAYWLFPASEGNGLFIPDHNAAVVRQCSIVNYIEKPGSQCPLLDNIGQTSILAGDGYDANDPKRTLAIGTGLFWPLVAAFELWSGQNWNTQRLYTIPYIIDLPQCVEI